MAWPISAQPRLGHLPQLFGERLLALVASQLGAARMNFLDCSSVAFVFFDMSQAHIVVIKDNKHKHKGGNLSFANVDGLVTA